MDEKNLTIKEKLVLMHQKHKELEKDYIRLSEEGASKGLDKLKKECEKLGEEILKLEKENYREGEFDGVFAIVYHQEPYLAQISMIISKIPDFSMPTMYVTSRRAEGNPEIIMGFNPIFFRSLTFEQRVALVCHELYHVIFQHIFGRGMVFPDKNLNLLLNFAQDMAINTIIGKHKLPEGAIIPGVQPLGQDGKPIDTNIAKAIKRAEPLQATEYYFELLKNAYKKDKQEQEENNKNNNGESELVIDLKTLDEHLWNDDDSETSGVPEGLREEIAEKIREAIEKATMRADREQQWGSVPMEVRGAIRSMISREVSWENVLRNFIGRVRSSERSSTVKRINKKVPYILPGAKRKMTSKMACFVDQSGSMSDKDIEMMFGELQSLNAKIEIDVFHFDTDVDVKNKMVWKRGEGNPKRLRTRCGGTDFNAVAKYCNSLRNNSYDGVIILTDGYAPTMGAIKNSRVLWVITEHGTKSNVRQGDLVVQMRKDNGNFHRY